MCGMLPIVWFTDQIFFDIIVCLYLNLYFIASRRFPNQNNLEM
jgi:hypothetical protein